MPKETIKTAVWLTSPSELNYLSDPSFEPYYCISNCAMEEHGWMKVQDVTVTFERPTKEGMVLASLELKETALRAKLAETLQALQDQRQNMRALPAPKECGDDIPF